MLRLNVNCFLPLLSARTVTIPSVSNFLKVDSLEITIFDSLNVDKHILTPEPDLRYIFVQRIDAKRDPFPWRYLVHLELEVVKGYLWVGIDSSLHSQAEDVLHRLKRWSRLKLPKQGPLLFQ
jgi:hypothetical protein